MPDDASKLTCEEFRRQLPEMVASGADIGDHSHMKACAMCYQLVRDLEAIAEKARHFCFGANDSSSDDWSEFT